jgi:enoyl-CoA hydratase
LVAQRSPRGILNRSSIWRAEEAERWGLVNRVLVPEELLEAALAIADRIAGNGPIAVRQAKQAIHRGLQMSLADGLVFEIEAYNRLIPTTDRSEGVLAFNERRKANFQGK